jgi:hypothetical protein
MCLVRTAGAPRQALTAATATAAAGPAPARSQSTVPRWQPAWPASLAEISAVPGRGECVLTF